MRTARFSVGDVVVALPARYLMQQTCNTSKFEDIPVTMVDMDSLIEANRTVGVAWFRIDNALSITVPTDLIKWEA